MLILILKSQTKKSENSSFEDQETALILREITFFRIAVGILADMADQLPFDLINLALDIFTKVSLPVECREKSQTLIHVFEGAIAIMESLLFSVSRHKAMSEDAKQESWLRILSIMQERILFNPLCHTLTGMTL
jgi:hypothetical protein